MESISGVAYGTPYTEVGFRQLLDSSIRPLYEAKGLLRVAFTKIVTEKDANVKGLVVKVTVEEGERYKLSKVQLAPNPAIDAQPGQPAQSRKVQAGCASRLRRNRHRRSKRITKMMQRKGYMRADATVERSLNDQLKTVDLTDCDSRRAAIHLRQADHRRAGPARRSGRQETVGNERRQALRRRLSGLFSGAHPGRRAVRQSAQDQSGAARSTRPPTVVDVTPRSQPSDFELPKNLAQHAQHHGGVALAEVQAADQAARLVFTRRAGERIDVAGTL